MVLQTLILKVWGSASWAPHPVMTGIVRWQFLLLRDTMWCNKRSSMQNSSRFEHHICILNAECKHLQSEIKKSCYNHDRDRSLIRLCWHNALRLMRTVCQIPRSSSLKVLSTSFAHALMHCDNKPLQNNKYLNHIMQCIFYITNNEAYLKIFSILILAVDFPTVIMFYDFIWNNNTPHALIQFSPY